LTSLATWTMPEGYPHGTEEVGMTDDEVLDDPGAGS
jgi:hypothetical protein